MTPSLPGQVLDGLQLSFQVLTFPSVTLTFRLIWESKNEEEKYIQTQSLLAF